MNTAADLLNIASFDAGCHSVVVDLDRLQGGCNTALAIDVAAIGGNSAVGTLFAMGGADAAAVESVAQTGSANDASEMLVGGAGVDTLGDVTVATLGGNALFGDIIPVATGVNTLDATVDADEPATTSRDLSVSVILHRIEVFSFLAPTQIGLRTGSAR